MVHGLPVRRVRSQRHIFRPHSLNSQNLSSELDFNDLFLVVSDILKLLNCSSVSLISMMLATAFIVLKMFMWL